MDGNDGAFADGSHVPHVRDEGLDHTDVRDIAPDMYPSDEAFADICDSRDVRDKPFDHTDVRDVAPDMYPGDEAFADGIRRTASRAR